MKNTTYTVEDDSVLEYSIGFPVLKKDLGVFLNGLKLDLDINYSFSQSSGTITLQSVDIGDVINIRCFRSNR